jgi:hypothetical protein
MLDCKRSSALNSSIETSSLDADLVWNSNFSHNNVGKSFSLIPEAGPHMDPAQGPSLTTHPVFPEFRQRVRFVKQDQEAGSHLCLLKLKDLPSTDP